MWFSTPSRSLCAQSIDIWTDSKFSQAIFILVKWFIISRYLLTFLSTFDRWLHPKFCSRKIVLYPVRIAFKIFVPPQNNWEKFHTPVKNPPPRHPGLKMIAPLRDMNDVCSINFIARQECVEFPLVSPVGDFHVFTSFPRGEIYT